MDPFIEIKNNIDEMTKHIETLDKNSNDFFTIKMYLNYIKAELYNVENLKKTDPEYIKTTLERVNIAVSEYKNRYSISNNDLAQAAQDAAEQMEIEEQEQKKQLPNNPEISSEELRKIDNMTEPHQSSTSKDDDDFDPYGVGNDNPFEFQQEDFDYMSGGGGNINSDVIKFNKHITFLNIVQNDIIDCINITENIIQSKQIKQEHYNTIYELIKTFFIFNQKFNTVNKGEKNTLLIEKYNTHAKNILHLFKIYYVTDEENLNYLVHSYITNEKIKNKYTLEQFKKTYTIFYHILNYNEWSNIWITLD